MDGDPQASQDNPTHRPTMQEIEQVKRRIREHRDVLLAAVNARYPVGGSIAWMTSRKTVAKGIVLGGAGSNSYNEVSLDVENAKTCKRVTVSLYQVQQVESQEGD